MNDLDERFKKLIEIAPDDPPPLKTIRVGNCRDCDKDVEQPEGATIPEMIFCYDCADMRRDGQRRWERITPPLYRATDAEHPEFNRKLWERIKDWQPHDGKGFGIDGESGTGKTRVCFLVLRRQALKGRRIAYVRAPEFARIVQCQFEERDPVAGQFDTHDKSGKNVFHRSLRKWRDADVLLFDDVGKVPRWSERLECEFFDLIEHRTSHLKPTIWTANAPIDELKLSEDSSEAIIRRLVEFSDPILRAR